MKVKLEGAGRSRKERMEARRSVPVPTSNLPPKLTTGGDAEHPEPAVFKQEAPDLPGEPEAAKVVAYVETPEPQSAPQPPEPLEPAAGTSSSQEPEQKPEPSAKQGRQKGTGTPARLPTSEKKASGASGPEPDSAKVRVTIFLTDEEAALLESQAKKIGGVSPEMLLKKLVREFDPPMLGLDPATEPELKPAGKVVRKYRADLRFSVPGTVLARYRMKYDKLGLYGDGLLVRHEAIPAFKSYMLEAVERLGA